jgi:hypothetical protein
MPDSFRECLVADFAAMRNNSHIMASREAGVPPPPADCETDGFSLFDWRRPKEDETPTADTPVSFRWWFQDGKLVCFAAYGWHRREIGYGRTVEDPEWGYGLLPTPMRDEAARRELSRETV